MAALFADGSNQQNSPFFGRQARLLNINTYTDGLAPLYLQGGHYFAYVFVILVPTGAIMMWGESFGGGAFVRFAKNAHGIATIIFCVAVLPLLFSWLKRMLPAIYDIKWMLIVGGYLSKKKQCLLVSLTLGKKAGFG